MEEEIWKPITENNDYEISSLGRVRSLDRIINCNDGIKSFYKEKILTSTKDARGRPIVRISVNNKGKKMYISRLIAIHFIPNPNNYPCVCHKNDIKEDNRIENLYWGTHKMNANDRTINNQLYGDNHYSSKITVVQANEIRTLIKEGKLNQTEIGNRYNIARGTVASIKRGSVRKYDNL